jgi:predicted small integral membrane protein
MMVDKIYLLAYLFIILALVRVVMTSWRGADAEAEASISRSDRIWVSVLLAAYVGANLAVAWSALRIA